MATRRASMPEGRHVGGLDEDKLTQRLTSLLARATELETKADAQDNKEMQRAQEILSKMLAHRSHRSRNTKTDDTDPT